MRCGACGEVGRGFTFALGASFGGEAHRALNLGFSSARGEVAFTGIFGESFGGESARGL